MTDVKTITQPAVERLVPVNLIGGPECGRRMQAGEHCFEITLPSGGGCYRFCPHASARLGRSSFLFSNLDPHLYAR